MKKILCIVGGMNAGGAETFLMKILRQLDRKKYQMDFCVGVSERCFYDDEIEKLGGKIFHITKKSKNPFKSFFDIARVVKKGNYSNVIRISQHSMSSIDLLAAKIGGAKNLIFRSSNSNSCGSTLNSILHIIFKPLAIMISNVKIAPSDVAAIHMFGKRQYKMGKIIILNNGLCIDLFKYDDKVRNSKRRELNILDNEFIIGHVGRFTAQKNHKFLIDIFKEYQKINNNSKLMLIGDGELKENVLKYIDKNNLNKKVLILGVRSDINELYQAMDCFVFPSLYEGMPNTVIEAQTSGLKCIISDQITKSVNLNDKVVFCPLNDINQWVKNVAESQKRSNDYNLIKQKGYDIKEISNIFTKYII